MVLHNSEATSPCRWWFGFDLGTSIDSHLQGHRFRSSLVLQKWKTIPSERKLEL